MGTQVIMIFQFLNGSLPDNKGRYLADILKFSNKELEYGHDYIQFLFPLYEESKFNLDAPTLNDLEDSFIRSDIDALKGLNSAAKRMIKFYRHTEHWATPINHNLLRITRILKSTSILLCKERSIELHEKILKRCYELDFHPPDNTLDFWEYATEGKDPPNKISTQKITIINNLDDGTDWWRTF
jgi:hypothetical protein